MINNQETGILIIHRFIIHLRDKEFRNKINIDSYLDDLEYLPALLLKTEDCSETFKSYVEEMSDNYSLPFIFEVFKDKL